MGGQAKQSKRNDKKKGKGKKNRNSPVSSVAVSETPSSIDSNSPNRTHIMQEGTAKRKHEGNPNDFPNKLAEKKPMVLDFTHQNETTPPPPSTPVNSFDFVGDDNSELFNNKPSLADLRVDSKFLEEVEVEPMVDDVVSVLIKEVCGENENPIPFDEEELEQPSLHEEECPDPDEIAIEITPSTQEAEITEEESSFLKTLPRKLWNSVPTTITDRITTLTPKTITNLFTPSPSTTQKFTFIPRSNSPQPHHSDIPIVFRIAAASIILYMMWPVFAFGSVTGVYLTPQAIRAKLVGVLNSFGLERFVPSLGPVVDDEEILVEEVV